jgi:hypothetical protein
MSKIIPIVIKNEDDAPPISSLADDKHLGTAATMAQYARTLPQKNLTQININEATRNTKVVFIMVPEWGIMFPPYNMARLSAITRAAGYETAVFDINIEANSELSKNSAIGYDPWDGSREFHWTGEWYHKELHQYTEPIFQRYIEKIVAINPSVICFSLYYTNEQAAKWMAKELKSKLPNTKIIVGGPQANKSYFTPIDEFDHVFQGEGEQILLEYLDKIENNVEVADRYIKQPQGQRIDLDSLPFPDYSDYDFNKYKIPNGISAEISRGCVAKCTFCAETLFWRYRGRLSGSILEEVAYQYENYGIDLVWFIDSLVNGNLKELRAFALGVVERGLKIKWNGYSRCDGRMDLAYYQDLKASGCYLLNYGIESGSQKVLDAMKKGTTVAEIEQNLRDGNAVGIRADTNWIIGFPNEDAEAFADTMTMMWRNRENSIGNMGTGLTLMQDPDTDIGINYQKYNITKEAFLGAWNTVDMTNTSIHRKIRIKTIEIFLQLTLPIVRKKFHMFNRENLKKSYSVIFEDPNNLREFDYEKFDYNIIKPNLNPLANSVVNEIWPVLRLLWRSRGAYEITLTFDPISDGEEFGRLASDYTASHHFKIDSSGNWAADFQYNLDLPDHPWGPWPSPKELEQYTDFKFNYHYIGTGHWD